MNIFNYYLNEELGDLFEEIWEELNEHADEAVLPAKHKAENTENNYRR